MTKQIKLIQLMNNLFASGFQFSEIIDFLERSKLAKVEFTSLMRQGMVEGLGLSEIFLRLQFSPAVVTQIALAESHGNLVETMKLVETNLRKIESVKKKLISIATYPVILLSFLILIMVGMKNYLIPELASDTASHNIAVNIVSNLPTIFSCLSISTLILVLLLIWKIKRTSPLKNYQFASRIPLIKGYTKLYVTAYFTREWGVLISQGLELKEIFQISSNARSKLFAEVGQELDKKLVLGEEFHKSSQSLKIFTPELSLMIEYGEMKGKLGQELLIFSEESWEKFFQKINQIMQLIQPLIFLFVALAIVLIYAAMLLPIYQNINMAV
ncbi:MAG: type II secretion system F family protein [Streptococcaceae bacterium]|nr:type II secretion system F family protein [Streptococcaceae bacterium]